MMEEYIYTKKDSLSPELCNTIIEYHKDETFLKYQGVTQNGLNKNIKDTTDLVIPLSDTKWQNINTILSEELSKNIKIYIHNLNNKENYKSENNYNFNYKHLKGNKVHLLNNFMIQKYDQNIGKYIYHEDGSIKTKKNSYRVITYLWYLNNVEEGGETEFFGGEFKIKPEEGKLLFFPACWCFPHRGNKPKSSDKYIVTGWFYSTIEYNSSPKIPSIISANMNFLELEPKTKKKIEKIETIKEETKSEKELGICEQKESEQKESEKDEFMLIYNYFFMNNKLLKAYIFQMNSNMLILSEQVIIKDIYSTTICEWIIHEIDAKTMWTEIKENEYFEINKYNNQNIFYFIMSSFIMISEYIKNTLDINESCVVLNIVSWNILRYNNEEELEVLNQSSDMVLTLILNPCKTESYKQGDIILYNKPVRNENITCALIVFLDFQFQYIDKTNTKKQISVKELYTTKKIYGL